MSDQNNFFAKALHDFTMNAAAGDSVRHLTDRGFTLSQIKETLSFPAPEGYIAKVMWERLVETHKVLVDDPARVLSDRAPVAQTVVETRDRYGRKSFLRIQKESPEETSFSPEDYVRYENLWVISNVLEQVSSLSGHIPPKDRSTGSHRDM